jgi:hypothetical protein
MLESQVSAGAKTKLTEGLLDKVKIRCVHSTIVLLTITGLRQVETC